MGLMVDTTVFMAFERRLRGFSVHDYFNEHLSAKLCALARVLGLKGASHEQGSVVRKHGSQARRRIASSPRRPLPIASSPPRRRPIARARTRRPTASSRRRRPVASSQARRFARTARRRATATPTRRPLTPRTRPTGPSSLRKRVPPASGYPSPPPSPRAGRGSPDGHASPRAGQAGRGSPDGHASPRSGRG